MATPKLRIGKRFWKKSPPLGLLEMRHGFLLATSTKSLTTLKRGAVLQEQKALSFDFAALSPRMGFGMSTIREIPSLGEAREVTTSFEHVSIDLFPTILG